jgi:hypothetical protein
MASALTLDFDPHSLGRLQQHVPILAWTPHAAESPARGWQVFRPAPSLRRPAPGLLRLDPHTPLTQTRPTASTLARPNTSINSSTARRDCSRSIRPLATALVRSSLNNGHRLSGTGDLQCRAFSNSYLQTALFHFLFDGGGPCGGFFF